MKTLQWLGWVALITMAACSSTTAPQHRDTDDTTCGDRPVGSTCQKPGGDCEALVCVGTSWTCPEGDVQAALTPDSCLVPDAGACGDRPVGSTCQKPGGGCEAQICDGASWTCPEGDTLVGLTPMNCQVPDGG